MTPHDRLTALVGFDVEVIDHDTEQAMQVGNTVYVTPAMYERLLAAGDEEVRGLLVGIEVLDLNEDDLRNMRGG